MNRQTSPLSTFRFAALAAATLAALALTGCSLDTSTAPTTISSESGPVARIGGHVMGGQQAIVGAIVTLWETDPGNTGYGKPTSGGNGAQPLESTTTSGIYGSFSFATSYTCTPGNFLYVTATGGNSGAGANATNNNLLLMTALGPCSAFQTNTQKNNTQIAINELSTVAAAYTLGNFMTVNDNGNAGTQLVYIGAPANNNAAAGSCSGVGSAMTCTAAGLTHAFADAAMLVDAVHFDGTMPSGLARTTVPGNSLGSVPQAVLNSLGAAMQYCTNSAGGVAGDSSPCGNLFTITTPVGGTTAPTDTLSAFLEVARYPHHSVGTSCVSPATGIFCLIPSNPPWVPVLTAAPHDWAIAIAYSGTGTVTGPAISAYTITGGVATFTTATNNFTVGETLLLSGFPSSTFLNGQSVQVVTATTTSFTANPANVTANVTGYSITSNVATFTANNSFVVGEKVALSGFTTGTYFNGQTVTITAQSNTSFSANFTNANVSQTTDSGVASANTGTVTETGATSIPNFGNPQWLALDANDNVYVQTGNTGTATQLGQSAMTNGGQLIWNNPWSNTQCGAGSLALDASGDLFASVYASSTGACPWGVYQYNASSGSQITFMGPGSGTVCNLTSGWTSTNCPGFTAYDTVHNTQSTPSGIAVDRLGNLWYDRRSTSCTQCLAELPVTLGTPNTFGLQTTNEGVANSDWDGAYQMIIDATGNVYVGTLNANIYVTPNTAPSTPNTPTYGTGATSATSWFAQPVGGSEFALVALDANNNLWSGYADETVEFTPNNASNPSGSTLASFTAGTVGTTTSPFVNTASKPESGIIDGGGVFWFGSYSTSGQIWHQVTSTSSPAYDSNVAVTAATNVDDIVPCYVPNGGSTCAATLPTGDVVSGDPHVVMVDSAGALWSDSEVTTSLSYGFILQVFGGSYPTWPLLQYAKYGTMPQ